jgi:hypothetical protein
MFDTELAVAIDTLDGAVSLFADRSLVEQAGLESALRTYAAADSLETDPVRVLLPSEAFETGSRWIRVASTKVRTT